MTIKVTATFPSADMADFALMRMRRGGVAFSSIELEQLKRENPQSFPGEAVSIVYPYTASPSLSGNGLLSGQSGNIGMRAMWDSGFSEPGRAPDVKSALSVSIDRSNLEHVRSILISSGGRNVSVTR